MPEITSVGTEGNDLVLRISFSDDDLVNELQYLLEYLEEDEYFSSYAIQNTLRDKAGITDYADLNELSQLIYDKVHTTSTAPVSTSGLSINNPTVKNAVMQTLAKHARENVHADYMFEESCENAYDSPLHELIQSGSSEPATASLTSKVESAASALGEYLDSTPRGQITRGKMKDIIEREFGSCSHSSSTDEVPVVSGWEPK